MLAVLFFYLVFVLGSLKAIQFGLWIAGPGRNQSPTLGLTLVGLIPIVIGAFTIYRATLYAHAALFG